MFVFADEDFVQIKDQQLFHGQAQDDGGTTSVIRGTMLRNFLGKWRLLPSRSIYPLGNPPKSCTYCMEQSDPSQPTNLKWEMIYETHDGKIGEVKYEMDVNGSYSAFDSPLVDEVMSELSIQESCPSLDSYSRKGGAIVQISHRILLSENELKIIQIFPANNISNIQFYERCDE